MTKEDFDVRRKKIEDRMSVYFKEIDVKEERNGKENMFYGWCYLCGICCVRNQDLATMYWLEGSKDNFECEALLELTGLDKQEGEKVSANSTATNISTTYEGMELTRNIAVIILIVSLIGFFIFQRL